MTSYRSSALAVALALSVGCSGTPESPTSPTGVSATDTVNQTVGVTLKATAPVLNAPDPGARFVATTVTLGFAPGRARFVTFPLAHEVVVRRAVDGLTVYTTIVDSSVASMTLPALDNSTYEWQVRAAEGNARGPWSESRTFTVAPPPTPTPVAPPTGVVGPPRSIPFREALDLVVNLHNVERWNLGSRSTREERVAFLWRAVAVLHYGHPVYNPKGPDSDWCVKDAGGGRPPSDDALVRCGNREAWDIILSSGGDGYHFHEDYLGPLGREQNVYPPPLSSLPR